MVSDKILSEIVRKTSDFVRKSNSRTKFFVKISRITLRVQMNKPCIKFLSEKCPFNLALIKTLNPAWLFVFMRFQKMDDFHFVRKCPKLRNQIYESRCSCGFRGTFFVREVIWTKILGQILGQNKPFSDKFSDKIDEFGKIFKSCIKPCILLV